MFVCLELDQFIRRQEEKTKRTTAISLSSSSEMDLGNFIFFHQDSENMNTRPQVNAVTCLFRLSYSVFWDLGTH